MLPTKSSRVIKHLINDYSKKYSSDGNPLLLEFIWIIGEMYNWGPSINCNSTCTLMIYVHAHVLYWWYMYLNIAHVLHWWYMDMPMYNIDDTWTCPCITLMIHEHAYVLHWWYMSMPMYCVLRNHFNKILLRVYIFLGHK